ncbi:MAG TPA: putative sulfate exporter family transporter [Xanthobacteraceae bacterium]|nr:putative sulfate exporter family transporter [Xanthobacteraceae bacterium]
MTNVGSLEPSRETAKPERLGWKELYLKEDWWAVWLGFALMVLSILLFQSGSSNILKALAINPGGLKWTSFGQLAGHFAQNAHLYLYQFVFWLVLFGATTAIMGAKLKEFVPAFIFLYVGSIIMFAIAGWANAAQFNLEAPLVALILGLIIANVFRLPAWMDSAFRVEYFIKTGIVLLGATFPITLVLTAGPVAIVQATIISIVTCLVIYFVGTRVFGLDKRLAAVMGVGGAVCGVSASMAIAASVNAKKDHLYTSVTLVVVWALVMIAVLPFLSRAMGLSAGVAGAWIGTSEFADAAGFAAATTYGKMVGAEDAAIKSFTLMKVIGRDLWIGIWSVVFAAIATFVWEKGQTGRAPDAREVWWRFPKFVIGFFAASLLMSAFTSSFSAADFNSTVRPNVLAPLVSLRTWTFIFCFLSIGLTTRFRDLHVVGWGAFWSFTIGVAVNVLLGYFLSVIVFGSYWAGIH